MDRKSSTAPSAISNAWRKAISSARVRGSATLYSVVGGAISSISTCYNWGITHSDRLYLRCTFCQNFVLLARTNANTRLFSDWAAVEEFIKTHLHCNPFYSMDNLCGIAGFEVTAWSEASQEDEGTKTITIDLPDEFGDLI